MLQFTLHAIRILNGYTAEEVAKHCSIPIDVYLEIEKDPSQTQLSLIAKIASMLNAPLGLIYPGTEVDCINQNRLLTTF